MIFDISLPPGRNFQTAAFRLWYDDAEVIIRGVVMLMPGAEFDGRPWVTDPLWQTLAKRHRFALVGAYFLDKPHPLMNIEQYVYVPGGSGTALSSALAAFGACTNHPELADAPLAFWGFSAGGEFNYEFAAWDPERVIAFFVNKGGIYYTALTEAATRAVPAFLCVGGEDTQSRISTVTGLFALNRGVGALWAFASEPGVAHELGRTREFGAVFLDGIIPLRLPDQSAGEVPVRSPLKPIDEKRGYIGDLSTFTFEPWRPGSGFSSLTAFLPTLDIARAWQSFSRGQHDYPAPFGSIPQQQAPQI